MNDCSSVADAFHSDRIGADPVGADEVDEVLGWVGAGLLDGTVDLVVERGAQAFESFCDQVVCRGVLVDEGEPLYELIAMRASPGQSGFGVCVCETSVCRR